MCPAQAFQPGDGIATFQHGDGGDAARHQTTFGQHADSGQSSNRTAVLRVEDMAIAFSCHFDFDVAFVIAAACNRSVFHLDNRQRVFRIGRVANADAPRGAVGMRADDPDVAAEINHALVLNQIGSVQVSTARPIVFDRYTENRNTGSFILIDPSTHFTCGAGMITEPVREGATAQPAPPSFAERLAHIARRAGSDEEAADEVRKAIEEMLT